MPAKKILIIENEKALSEMYKMKFEQEGFKAVVIENGLRGIAAAKRRKPDLILLDLVLAGLSGYEILKKFREDPETRNLKIYILSNLGQDGEIDKSFAAGADGYLVKANLTPSQLVENAKKIFNGQEVGIRRKPESLPAKTLERAALWQARDGRGKEEELKKGTGLSVLLIEDEETIVEMYKLRLTKGGYEVEIAKNGAWGIKRAKEKNFDVIVMDMMMPAMNGYKAIAELKSDEKTKEVPIIVLSNSAQDRDVERAKGLGAASYLLKSGITPARLVREIEKALKIKN